MTEQEAQNIIRNAKPIELPKPKCRTINLKEYKGKTLEEQLQDLKRLEEFYKRQRKYNNISKKVRYGSCK